MEKMEKIEKTETLKELRDNYYEPFKQLMMQYECAMLEIQTKLEVLNKELSLRNSRNPFESIKCRLKSPESIVEKLIRNDIDVSVENIEKNLNDVAGIRVICSFPEDIYNRRLRNARTRINTGFFLSKNKTTPHWFMVQ